MAEYYFISYSSVDGAAFRTELDEGLKSASPPIETWVDDQRIHLGEHWDDQIVEALRNCKGLLFVMTPDSVRSNSICKLEWSRALKYKKPVIPLYLHSDIEIPFRLEIREYVDFTQSFEVALERLRNHLIWIDTPEGVLHSLKNQLSELERELPRTDPTHQLGIQDAMLELQQRIEAQQILVNDPQGASRRTENRIASELERIQMTEPRGVAGIKTKFVNPPPAVAPTWFQDRHIETGLIAEFIRDEAQRLMIVLGRAGIGKTTMVCRLLKSLEADRLPDGGESLSVDGIVYLSALGSRRVNFSHMFVDLCSVLPENTGRMLQALHQDAKTSTIEEMRALLENFQSKRILVLLDNFEDIVDTQSGEIQDDELETALRALLQLPQHGVKIIMTTRVAPRSLQLVEAGRQTMLELDKGLESPYAENILRAMDRDGKIGLRDAPPELLAMARERTRGYPRALEALFAILAADRDTSLPEILSEASQLLPENVVQVLVGEAFSRLDPLAQKVMQALAIYNYPVPTTAIDYLLQPYNPGIDSKLVLKSLVNMQFVRRETGLYYLHHVDRAYALDRIPPGQPADWQSQEQTPFTRCALCHRGAEYFRKVRREESTWNSIEDIKPLFVEFELLCASQDFEEALIVLNNMIIFLEREGSYRQIERMADHLIQNAKEPVRSHAMGLAGLALFGLGENQDAIKHFNEALKLPDLDTDYANNLRFDLATCFGIESDFESAVDCYQAIITASPDDVVVHVKAQLGLGWIAEIQNSFDEAEAIYMDTLKNYLHAFTMEVTADETFIFNPDVLTPDAPFQDPSAWHPINEIFPDNSVDPADSLYIFGVQLEAFPELEDGTEIEVSLAPVLVTVELARIWERIASFYEKMDRLVDAYESCRLALFMYDVMEEDTGIALTLEALRRMAPQFSDDEAQAIIEEQERELERARASNHRKLEITIMQNLAQSYMVRNRLQEAEQFYIKLSQHARELEFTFLGQQAEFGLAYVDWFNDRPKTAIDRLLRLLDQGNLDMPLYADILALLGRIEFARGDRTSAAQYAVQANQVYLVLQSPYQSLEMEQFLAAIAIDERDYETGVQRLAMAYQQAHTLGIPSVVVQILCDLANAYLSAGQEQESIDAANEAYRVASEIELPALAADTLMTVGQISAELRIFDLSKNAYLQAQDNFESIGNMYGQNLVYNGLAWMYYLMDQPQEQLQAARKAWELAKEIEDPVFSRTVRMQLASALSDNSLHQEAIEHFEIILSEDPSDALARVNFGWVLFQASEYDRSLEESHRALEIDETQTFAIRNLGHAYLAKGLPGQAEHEYRRAIQERKGGEHFIETIRVVKKLLSEKPGLPRGQELLEMIEAEQSRLDADKNG